MASKKQFSLQAALIGVLYVAMTCAWLSACVLRRPTTVPRPSPLCLLSAVLSLVAWRRLRGGDDIVAGFVWIVLATHLAAAGFIGQFIATLQTIPSHSRFDWNWYQAEVGGMIVGNLVWPFVGLLPAVGTYMNGGKSRQSSAARLLKISLLAGIVGTASAAICVSLVFARM